FRNLLVTGNIFRHVFAWSYVIEQRYGSGYGGGNGFYLDYASGVHVYRNIAYNNSGAGYKLSCLWRDGDALFYNNIAANNYIYGMKMTGTDDCDNHEGSVNTQIVNNMFINNGQFGFQLISETPNTYGNLIIDHNLYYKNGWGGENSRETGNIQLFNGAMPFIYLNSLVEIRKQTAWEEHGIRGNPRLAGYNPADHAAYTLNWPDFHPTRRSYRVIDKGSGELPLSLRNLLQEFEVKDISCDHAFEIGAFEWVKPSSVCTVVYEVQTSNAGSGICLPMNFAGFIPAGW
ncbi:MAG: right-handed parallel beta-helix repeat-containing protein, partial [Anaerolineaceae bacterium]